MKHLAEGTIRAAIDEPSLLFPNQREHLATCPKCQRKHASVHQDHRFALMLMQTDQPNLPVARAISAELAVPRGRASSMVRTAPRVKHGRLPWALAPVALIGCVLALTLTPASTLGRNFLTIFQPTRLTPISVTAQDLRDLPNLRHYGTLRVPGDISSHRYSTVPRASARAGFNVLTPSSIPSSVSGPAKYEVLPAEQSSFRFNAAKAEKFAKMRHRSLPAMPAGIDGSTLVLQTHAAVVAVYGSGGELPQLVIGQTPIPTVSSSKASFSEIERYLLRLPGISAHLASQIRAIGSPTQSLPLPVPVNLAYAHSVTVDGTHGLLVGDNTGVGSVVIWEKNKRVIAVGGTLTQDQALQVANSLR